MRPPSHLVTLAYPVQLHLVPTWGQKILLVPKSDAQVGTQFLLEQVHLPLLQVKSDMPFSEQQEVSVKDPSQSQADPSLGQKPSPWPPMVLQSGGQFLLEQVQAPLLQVKSDMPFSEQQSLSVNEPLQSQADPSLGHSPFPGPPMVSQSGGQLALEQVHWPLLQVKSDMLFTSQQVVSVKDP